MIISTHALVDNIAFVVEHELGPAVAHDPWLASYVRSITRLLPFLRNRIDTEGSILDEDNRDLRALLGELASTGVVRDAIDDAIACDGADAGAYITVEQLRVDNSRYRALLDDALPELHDPKHRATLERVHEYLKRSAEREGPMYVPLFGGPPF